MSLQLVDSSSKDDLKTQFVTREGEYRLMTLSEYSRPNRVGYQNNQNNPQVRVSLVTLPSQVLQLPDRVNNNGMNLNVQSTISGGSVALGTTNSHEQTQNGTSGLIPNCSSAIGAERICFNYGKELYVYAYRGAKKASDSNKPIDKKLYKGTNPSCHEFNATAATYEGAPLLVGFSTGQIQLVYPGRRDQGKLYNEERLIDKTKVTCLKWIPGADNQFLASHSSGCLYAYNEELPCTPTTPSYQPHKCGDGYIILAGKSKVTRNPLYKWCFGHQENASINEFSFSPCDQHIAIVSQDGFLRVFQYNNMELIGVARSYFGGFLCVCWSPDGKYVVVGGEDDLVTVYSLKERRVVARGQGHRSWVSVVAFDPYTTSYSKWNRDDFSDDENQIKEGIKKNSNHGDSESIATAVHRPSTCRNSVATSDKLATCYRLGSVSQDTQLCLWDITEDVLRQSMCRLTRSLSSSDSTSCKAKSEFSKKSRNSYCGQPTVSHMNYTRSIANTTVINDSDTAESSKYLFTDTIHTAINCDDSNSRGAATSVEGKSLNNYKLKTNCVNSDGISSVESSNKKEKDSDKVLKFETNHQHQLSTFNSITQRFSNLGFGYTGNNYSNNSEKYEKLGKSSKRSIISFVGKSNHSNNNSTNSNKNIQHSDVLGTCHDASNGEQPILTPPAIIGGGISNAISSIMTSSSLTKNKRSDANGTGDSSTGIISSYDPVKLIGTSACPRFDDCPVLEPLIASLQHVRMDLCTHGQDLVA